MDTTVRAPAGSTPPVGADTPVRKHASDCPVEELLAFLGHRWNALILWHLQTGPKRHGELVERLAGVTPKVLTERLDGLEQRRIVSREILAGFPRRVLYALTPRGRSLVLVLDRLEAWSKADGSPSAATWPGSRRGSSCRRLRVPRLPP
jgi:DNA-binding HxlR family transcriptional regulator